MKRILYLLLFLPSLSIAQVDTVSIYFDLDEFDLSEQDKEKLSEVINNINKGSIELKSIEAHTDTSGSIAYNRVLSQKRLNSVLHVLNDQSRNITTASFGESIASKDQKYNPASYRKVDVITSQVIIEEIVEIEEEVTDEQKLNDDLNTFLTDTTSETLIQLSVNFYPGKAILLAGEEEELYVLYRFLKVHPNVKAKIRGHVCCGSNMMLSQNRAFVVYDYLVERGISPSRLTHRGYDNSQPFIWPEETEEDKSKNRRVDVVFTK